MTVLHLVKYLQDEKGTPYQWRLPAVVVHYYIIALLYHSRTSVNFITDFQTKFAEN